MQMACHSIKATGTPHKQQRSPRNTFSFATDFHSFRKRHDSPGWIPALMAQPATPSSLC